jgi:uncharacterized protein YciI
MKFVIVKTTVGTLEDQQQALGPYLEFLQRLRERQVLVGAGGFEDRSGGIMMIEVPGLEEAVAIAREDPLVKAGVASYTVHGWRPWVPRGETGLKSEAPSADAGPLEAENAEESFQIVEATAESSYADFLITCFLPDQMPATDPLRCDYVRRSGRRGLRKLLLLSDDEVAGQLEFAPPGVCGLPIEGEELAIIHCLWLKDAFTGLGGAQLLLASCAEISGAQSLATIGYNTSLPWLPKSFFEKQGFTIIDQAETGRFSGNTPIVASLLWRPLVPEAKRPTWDRAALLEGVDFCPHYPWMSGKLLYRGTHFDYHGQVVKEGLRRPELLQQVPVLGAQRIDKWTLVKFGLPSADLNRALDLIQSALISEPTYYATIYGGEQVFVVFPDRVFKLGAAKAGPGWQEVRRYGLDKGIPDEELVFPTRFEDETF